MSENFKELQKGINALFPNLKVEASADIIHIPAFGLKDLKVEIDNRIVFRFYKISYLNPEDVALYLQTKMNFDRISKKYFKKDSFYLYPNESLNSDPKGAFEKRMFILRIIKDAQEALSQLKIELGAEKQLN